MKFSTNFLVRPSKAWKSGLVSIECCISVNNKRLYQRLPRQIQISDWDDKKKRVRSTNPDADEINKFLHVYIQNLYIIHSKIIERNLPYHIQTFKDGLNGDLDDTNKTLIELYQGFNTEYLKLKENNQVSHVAYQRHEATLKRLQDYLKSKYNKNNILLRDVNKSFVEGFYLYLRGLGLQNNSAINYIKKFKRVINMALNDGIMEKNPFSNYKLHIESTDATYLTLDEIKTIYNKKFKTERLTKIKDIFIFACFTGMSYVDCSTFDYGKHVVKDELGYEFIIKKRHKTNVTAMIPLLPIAKEILEKYERKLPVTSNQKTNEYLKEIGAICGITKELHFHVARHSFATSVTLNNGVQLTSVSKMMGHTNTKMTQRYAKVLTGTLLNEAQMIMNKIDF